MKAVKAASAKEKLAAAQKALARKSFFRPAPDYDVAERQFKGAGMDFKLCGDIDAAINAYEQAADCALKTKNKFSAAGYFETAGKMAQDKKTSADLENALRLYDRACTLFQESDNVTGAVEIKFRIGRSLFRTDAEKSAKFLVEASNIIDISKNDAVTIDVFSLTLNVLVKTRKLAEALKHVRRYSKYCKAIGRRDQLFKNNLTETILLCAIGDVAAADQALMDHFQNSDYLQQAEAATAEDLIEAYRKLDGMKLEALQKGRGFRFLENEVAKLFLTLRVTKSEASSAPASSNTKSATEHGDLASFSKESGDAPALPKAAEHSQQKPQHSTSSTPASAESSETSNAQQSQPAESQHAASEPVPAPEPEPDSDDSSDGGDLFA